MPGEVNQTCNTYAQPAETHCCALRQVKTEVHRYQTKHQHSTYLQQCRNRRSTPYERRASFRQGEERGSEGGSKSREQPGNAFCVSRTLADLMMMHGAKRETRDVVGGVTAVVAETLRAS